MKHRNFNRFCYKLVVANGCSPQRGVIRLRRIAETTSPTTEIIRRISQLFERLGKIEKNYEKIKAYINKLEQSILAKAFRGELVPQEMK